MSRPAPLVSISLGVVIERRKAKSAWTDYVWRPVAVLPGLPDAQPWAPLEGDVEIMRFYLGGAQLALHRSDVPRYAENLAADRPDLWVVLRPTGGAERPYEIVTITANPNEGEASTESGSDMVDAVPMPESVQAAIAAFVAEYPMHETHYKRERNRADPEALARHGPRAKDAKR